jgi:hypothetical protein
MASLSLNIVRIRGCDAKAAGGWRHTRDRLIVRRIGMAIHPTVNLHSPVAKATCARSETLKAIETPKLSNCACCVDLSECRSTRQLGY